MIARGVIKTRLYESPCGTMTLGSFGDKLCLCEWHTDKHGELACRRLKRILNACLEEDTSGIIEKAAAQLNEFFAGRRRVFDVPLLLIGTDFQKTVWGELMNVPFGKTLSYGEMARRIGRAKAVRAVANANGANPVCIFVPCHGIIGSDHSLTGYAGGIDAKRRLLELEGVWPIKI